MRRGKGWSVRAWGEEGVYMEGVECACMGRGRVCFLKGWSVHAWGEGVYMEGVECASMGEGGCVHMEGVECASMERGRL